jgi:hypothetical protein
MGGKQVSLQQGGEDFRGTVVRIHPCDGITLRLSNDEQRSFAAESVANVRELPRETPAETEGVEP